MKPLNIILLILMLVLFSACGDKVGKEINIQETFKSEIKKVYEIAENKGTQALEKIDKETVFKDVSKIFDENLFKNIQVKYNDVLQGIITDASGNKIGGFKLPVDINFEGTQEEIKLLMNSFENITSKIAIEDLKIEKSGENFKLSCVIEFFGNEKISNAEQGKSSMTAVHMIQGNSGEINKIVLRDYDLLMVLRPYTSDGASMTLEAVGNSKGTLYSDTNEAEDLAINFKKKSDGYLYESLINGKIEENSLNIKNDKIIFDIASCSKEDKQDKVGVNLRLNNQTDKTVSICIFDDQAQRVSIVEKTKNIEVEKQ